MQRNNIKVFVFVLFSIIITGCNADNGAKETTPNTAEFHSEIIFNNVLERHYAIPKLKNMDNWDDGGEVSRYVYAAMGEYFPQASIHRSGEIQPLNKQLNPAIAKINIKSALGQMTLDDYIARDKRIDGLVILHRGKIVYEAYPNMHEFDQHIWFSVSKVIASSIVAILEDQGLLSSEKLLTDYLPELKGSGWEGVKLIHALNMMSGVDCIDADAGDYSNPDACIYAMEASQDFVKRYPSNPTTVYEHLASVKPLVKPGTRFRYSGADTFILSWVAERVTGTPYSELIRREIWSRMGAESTGFITLSNDGAPVTQGGISSTLGDMARFGLLFTPSWPVISQTQIISDSHLAKIQQGEPTAYLNGDGTYYNKHWLKYAEPAHHNSYQWDYVTKNGDIFKAGFGGQGLYISPSRDLVIAYFGTQDQQGARTQLLEISPQLASSKLFSPRINQ